MKRVEINQSSYVLSMQSFRETSILVDLFTLNHGRVTIVAKGARKKSKRPALQLFTNYELSWSGMSDIKNCFSWEEVGHSRRTYSLVTYKYFYQLFYINELLKKILKVFDAHRPLFELYKALINTCSSSQSDIKQYHILYFELQALKYTGYGIVDSIKQEEIDCSKRYMWKHGVGFTVLHNEKVDMGVSGHCILAISNNSLEILSDIDIRNLRILVNNIFKQQFNINYFKTFKTYVPHTILI
ncbi:MAG: DNA repair protein RecO [Methylacidiphilales bacterium]|nr:DNA repair protein RecO [Candidatus Methylacidiphilales bacterium]